MPITEQQLLQIFPNAGRQAGVFVPVLNTAMNRYGIVGTSHSGAFIAQVGHESCQVNLSPQPPLISGGSGISPTHF